MKREEIENRYCDLEWFMEKHCHGCTKERKCDEYDKLISKGKSNKEAKIIVSKGDKL